MNPPLAPQALVLINTGGTFNKRYNPLLGTLDVPTDAHAIEQLLTSARPNLRLHLIGRIHKDSLDITATDRAELVDTLRTLPDEFQHAPVLIVHGTDTLDQTATALEAAALNRLIILTGAMRPADIDPVEPALHLGLALGFIAAAPPAGVYVAMHGLVRPHRQLVKDRAAGVFKPPI